MFGIKTLSFANQRPAGTTDAIVSTTTNVGGLKINVNAARILDVNVGDYINVSVGEDNEAYITKGWAGFGSKVAPVGGKDSNSGAMTCSSANIYETLKGGNDIKKEYLLSEDTFQTMTDEQVDALVAESPKKGFEALRGKKFFKLTFSQDVVKTARKEKG